MSSQAGRSRSLLPDRLLLYSYIPPMGQAPPMEEVSALRLEDAQEIINRWEPFNRGESPAAQALGAGRMRLKKALKRWPELRQREMLLSMMPRCRCGKEC